VLQDEKKFFLTSRRRDRRRTAGTDFIKNVAGGGGDWAANSCCGPYHAKPVIGGKLVIGRKKSREKTFNRASGRSYTPGRGGQNRLLPSRNKKKTPVDRNGQIGQKSYLKGEPAQDGGGDWAHVEDKWHIHASTERPRALYGGWTFWGMLAGINEVKFSCSPPGEYEKEKEKVSLKSKRNKGVENCCAGRREIVN